MKLVTISSIITLAIASTNVLAGGMSNDEYRDNLLPSEINTNVDMKIHDDHYEDVVDLSKMQANVPILSEDAQDFDSDEYEAN